VQARLEPPMQTVTRSARACGRAIALAAALAAGAAAQQPPELIVRNGVIVTAVGRSEGDLRIRNGTIAEIGRNLTAAAGARVIDAKGLLVLPGGVDPHVHLTPVRTATTLKGADDYTSASRAALAGGTTTISNFITQVAGTSLETTLAGAMDVVRKQAIADVILHLTVGDPNAFTPADVAILADRGLTLKIFMVRPAFDQNAAAYTTLIRAAGAAGLLTMIHCEDASIVSTTQQRMMAEGRGALKGQNFAESRPVVAEEIATQRAVGISEATGAPLYIVHISSERAMQAAEAGQARGLPVFTEVRFLYLHLTRERFDEPNGAIYTGDPPLREKSDADYLWGALARGTVNVVDTDHVGYTREDKLDPSLDIINHRPAGNYLQVQLPLLYSEGVRKGRITLERMVALTSTNPARLFGLYPRKGTIAVGSDADIVIWDPNLKRTIRDEDQLANAKFSIFSGWEVTGWPVVTVRRGEVVYQDGKILAAPGSGQLTARERWRRP
jgi:dihydropyrimidinase